MIMMMNAFHHGETESWTRTNACRSCSFCLNPLKWCLSESLFSCLGFQGLFKVFVFGERERNLSWYRYKHPCFFILWDLSVIFLKLQSSDVPYTIFRLRLALTAVTDDCLVYEKCSANYISRPDLHMYKRIEVFFTLLHKCRFYGCLNRKQCKWGDF